MLNTICNNIALYDIYLMIVTPCLFFSDKAEFLRYKHLLPLPVGTGIQRLAQMYAYHWFRVIAKFQWLGSSQSSPTIRPPAHTRWDSNHLKQEVNKAWLRVHCKERTKKVNKARLVKTTSKRTGFKIGHFYTRLLGLPQKWSALHYKKDRKKCDWWEGGRREEIMNEKG